MGWGVPALSSTHTRLALAVLARSAAGRFREDLLARIQLWTFSLPALRDRREDLEPNLDYELRRFAETEGRQISFNKEAREAFLCFAEADDTLVRIQIHRSIA